MPNSEEKPEIPLIREDIGKFISNF
ncbi:hypothetical protein CAEBREN_30990 [Caenorhabditis brenneri]|uniref:Uncharacterized protein n=1 Tax=Caenorhabditis brenneri TaxID=135651 RepID=G0P4X5_CAEBE|nr:hypothetical protein CAEBREN_30990 [Caenorhabditis brenneri]